MCVVCMCEICRINPALDCISTYAELVIVMKFLYQFTELLQN